jgi:S-adenosylmethionine synthetase
MTMEAAAGKNPVSHVGKLYNIAANRIAVGVVAELPDVFAATCTLVSQIGAPIDQPAIVDVTIATTVFDRVRCASKISSTRCSRVSMTCATISSRARSRCSDCDRLGHTVISRVTISRASRL